MKKGFTLVELLVVITTDGGDATSTLYEIGSDPGLDLLPNATSSTFYSLP